MTDADRVQMLNRNAVANGDYVLYWMQQSQRAIGNPALDYAIQLANECAVPVLVCFVLQRGYGQSNRRHYGFMLQGLMETEQSLRNRGIAFVLKIGTPETVVVDLARRASTVVCDRGYLRLQKQRRIHCASTVSCRMVQVEGDVVVPVATASDKAEYAARTIRPKIHRLVDAYLHDMPDQPARHDATTLDVASDIALSQVDEVLGRLAVDNSVKPVKRFHGGYREASRRLTAFVQEILPGYASARNEPALSRTSMLSPYLHFGQISPVEIALAVKQATHAETDDRKAFLEELIVRRELAVNFIHYRADYDRYSCIPDWAQRTLSAHCQDRREYLYTETELMAADTHDPCWNAAMREMVETGFMHNYMRMYWAKKILEWTPDPETAFQVTRDLNNRYFIDGRDANSYAGVAWCFGLHDRPWKERPVFGTVRYMNERGLRRKFDMDAYIAAVDALVAAERTPA